MERRVILAILLMLIIAVLPSILFPPKKQPGRRVGGSADSANVARESIATPAPAPASLPAQPSNRLTASLAETVWVTSPLYRLGFSTQGGALGSAARLDYKSLAPADSGHPVQLVPSGRPMLVYARTSGTRSEERRVGKEGGSRGWP